MLGLGESNVGDTNRIEDNPYTEIISLISTITLSYLFSSIITNEPTYSSPITDTITLSSSVL